MAEPDSLQPLLAEKWNQGLSWTAFLDYATRNVPQMRQSYDQTQIPADLAEKVEALQQPIRLTAIGVVIGLAVALGLGVALKSLLFGVRPGDPAILLGVAAALVAVSLLAAFFPALSASRTDPARTLRET